MIPNLTWLLHLHWSRYIIFLLILISVFAVDYFGRDEEDDEDFHSD